MNNVRSLKSILNQKETTVFHATGFTYHLNDTICAIRSGLVFKSNADMRKGEKRNETYSSERDKIEIEQKDGTLAYYSFTAPVKLLVMPGDKVIPGQPLAVFDSIAEKYHLILNVNYLDSKKLTDYLYSGEPSLNGSFYISLPLKFYFDENKTDYVSSSGLYRALHPLPIVTAEMSKKEKKKFDL